MCECVGSGVFFAPADALVTHRGHYNDRITRAVVHFAVMLADFPPRWVLIVWLPETNPECLPENQTTSHRVQLHERIPLCFSLLIRLSGQGWRRRLVAVLRDTCQSAREEAAAPRGDNRGHEIISVVTNGPYLRLMSAPRKPPSSQLISPSLRLVLSCHRSFGVPSLPITSSDILSGLIGGWLHLFGVLSE